MSATLQSEYRVSVPVGSRGYWRVEHKTIADGDAKFGQLRAAINGHGRYVPAGQYTGLLFRGSVVMSDTPDEIRDHMGAINAARGRCLINGLGLGVVLQAVARKSEVDHVTVIEIDEDVIALVGPHYEAMFPDRIDIIKADAFAYRPPRGVRYGMVWHDIWPTICSDNLPEMARLRRKYARRADWQGCWARAECLRSQRRGY